MPNHSFANSAKREAAITIENLGKKYHIGQQRAKDDGMRHVIESAVRTPLAWFRARRQERLKQVDFWALRGVSLEIKRGDVVGIIGGNGAGKSTLLKLLSRITVPTEGRIRIDGRVASLLEVGTGFHPELTGRENIFLNGAILGMSRSEILRKFDQIVEFAEIDEFLDTPVKRYSSGMYVRLAFAVAAHLDPEILIVDEVLAVGDASFQKKCLAQMGNIAGEGRTVVFVSHNVEAVRTLCQRVIWIKDGLLHRDGEAEEVIGDYFDNIIIEKVQAVTNRDFGLILEDVVLRNEHGEECREFKPGDDLTVEIHYDAQKSLERPYIILSISGNNGGCFAANMLLDGRRPEVLSGRGKLSCRFRSIPLYPQKYAVRICIRDGNGSDNIIPYQDAAYFSVACDLADYGYQGQFVGRAATSTPVVVPYEWHLPDGTIAPMSLEAASRVVTTR
jgi:lipopolysaccharide transport system ATP-binding protein